ncbi:CgeB family protein [Anaeromyxobacter terrae]|uniref:CgeB family protein n=1 Tax=Anaeromyxobacter terrae TaxID=2925406 RepID=UPI001F574774|nr:glycosyltransferase [Anaeromyxobacter sp. SG22]
MKIMVVGYFHSAHWEPASVEALARLGHHVVGFDMARYWGKDYASRVVRRLQPRLAFARANRDLVAAVRKERPDAVYCRRSIEISADTLRTIRADAGAVLVSYMNDDPFGFRRGHPMWRAFVEAIPEYDVHLVFREVNVPEFHAHGARRCRVLLPYFVPELHRRLAVTEEDRARYGCDAIFIGHGAVDHRVAFLRKAAEAGCRIKVFGPHWSGPAAPKRLGGIEVRGGVFGEEYVKAINAARVCLCFYDHGNRDALTTRNMEIPACGSVLVAERTEAAMNVHVHGEEALFFDSPEEMIEHIRVLRDPALRDRIGGAGLAWAAKGEHRVEARMAVVVDEIERVRTGGDVGRPPLAITG